MTDKSDVSITYIQRTALYDMSDDGALQEGDGDVVNMDHLHLISRRALVLSQTLATFALSNQVLARELTDSPIYNEPKECKNGGLVSGEPVNTYDA